MAPRRDEESSSSDGRDRATVPCQTVNCEPSTQSVNHQLVRTAPRRHGTPSTRPPVNPSWTLALARRSTALLYTGGMADTTTEKKRILFLCTGNAARSQMAEAIARAFHGDRIDAVSAGSHPAGWVHPLAVEAMAQQGVDMTGQYSKSAEPFLNEPFDVVVTVCDSAAADCPNWPGAKRIEHWPIKDPSWGIDDPATRLDRFLATRDDLERRIDELVKTL